MSRISMNFYIINGYIVEQFAGIKGIVVISPFRDKHIFGRINQILILYVYMNKLCMYVGIGVFDSIIYVCV